jgi:hypothetical protein
MQVLNDLLDQMLADAGLTRDGLLWGAMLIGFLLATLHLTTMFLTRWGDRGATPKSLVFSMLVHFFCGLGLVAMQPEFLQEPATQAEEEPIKLREVFVEGEEKIETNEPGNTPFWEEPSAPIETQLTRLDRVPPELSPMESPLRQAEPVNQPDISVPDIPSQPFEPVVIPKPDRQGSEGLRAEAAIPLKVDDAIEEARPELLIPSSSHTRRRLARRGQVETRVVREPKRGAIDRIERKFDASRELASLDAASEPGAVLRRGPVADKIRRRVGPAPSAIPAPEAGTAAPVSTEAATQGSPTPPQISRIRTRTIQSRADGALEPFRPERTPKDPQPTSPRSVNVREGEPVTIPHEGFRPNILRPKSLVSQTREHRSVPSTYRLRNLARRQDSARKFGGTDASERAVESSLRWLVLHQSSDGHWDAGRFGSGNVKLNDEGLDTRGAPVKEGIPGSHASSGVTALAVLAFLGAGYTHEEGQYAQQVDRALRWLIRQQHEDGFLGGEATYFARMYCHAMASYAMAEAYGMQSDPTYDTGLREPLERAIVFILEHQNPNDGGWRYKKGQLSDMSMFGWQLMALKSAEIAGIGIPERAKSRMVRFLKERSLGTHNGLASYRVLESSSSPLPPTPAMTAESLFCKQMLGIRRTNPASTEAVEYLLERLPKRSETNLYYWYYGTLAMYQYGGESWRKWNESLRDQLVAEQLQTGEHSGSWDPNGPWGAYGGRVYSTALSTLCLEVYYRFLPLYQMGGRYDDE